MKKRFLSIITALALCLSLLPTVALAAEDGVMYLDENGAEQIYTGSYTEITQDYTAWGLTTGWYVVNSNVTTDMWPNVKGDVHLILADNCSLSVGYLFVNSGNSLTIYAQSTGSNMGALNAGSTTEDSSAPNAGIGGSYGSSGGVITINGGNITASSFLGAGIGGSGRYNTNSGDGGAITINGGIVTATSILGAGIGGGGTLVDINGGNGGKITINGGTVIATSTYGAGIGGGNGGYEDYYSVKGGDGGIVTINGGNVTATSTYCAGIGGSRGHSMHDGSGADVTITGGTVTASTTNTNIAAIGWSGPIAASPGALIITGGNITPPTKYYEYDGIAGIKPDGGSNLVAFGNLTLPVDLTIPEGKTLTIPSGASLTIPEGKTLIIPEGVTLTNNGTLINNGTIINFGTINGTVNGNTPKTVAAKYLDENGEEQTAFCDAAITADNPLTTWGEPGKTTWYVVQGDVSISQGVTFSGDVHLILADGCDLTVSGGIMGNSGANLTIYGQANGTGTLTATGSNNTSGSSYGIYACLGDGSNGGNITISGNAEVNATGNDAETISCGIYVGNQLTINGSTVKAEGGSAADSTGIYANKQLTITDSTVKVKVGDAKDFSKGIATFGSVTITGGSVEVKAGTAGTTSNGIFVSGDVTITGGSHVTVHAPGNGTNGRAMNKSPQLPATYWWRTADTDPFTASGTEPYVHYYGDDYVEFTDSFTITLDPNFDGGESGAMTTGADGKLTGNLPTPTRDGYTFDGWFTEATGGEKVTNETVFNGYVTIYAHWMAKSSGGSYTPTYAPTVTQPDNGSVTVSPKSPRKGVTVTITPTPDAGYTVEQILVTDKNGDPVEVINNGDGTYSFTQPAGKVNINVTFMEDNSMLNFFVDVPADAYYYDAVLWAAENGITGGVDDIHFAPNAPCTRAQIVTFLWRAAGCPEPESLTSLSDVPADAYYAKAVAWALENGITTGTGDGTTFSPNATCTRAQAMAFIYRSEQARGGGMQGAWMFLNPFDDVNLENYYGEAVMWAVANGVTDGTSDTTFSPGADCTRAQIVTFLYRFFVK